MQESRRCASAEEMRSLGRELAGDLRCGMVVALNGELGAGKTELVKGLAEGLAYHGPVTSPTFTLVHEYRGGRLPLFHFDFYRVQHAEEVLDLGWDEMTEEGVCAVEWADRFSDLMPSQALRLRIEIQPDGGRVVSQWPGGTREGPR